MKLDIFAHHILRYGLVLILFWIGAMKFSDFEAQAIKPLIETSPLMSWLYALLDVQAVSNLLGVTEIGAGLLIALRPWAPRLAALGSTVAVGMFLTTLTFLFTLPGWEASLGGFPAISSAGGFLIKDVVLLGTALWSLSEAVAAIGSADEKAFVGAHALRSSPGRS